MTLLHYNSNHPFLNMCTFFQGEKTDTFNAVVRTADSQPRIIQALVHNWKTAKTGNRNRATGLQILELSDTDLKMTIFTMLNGIKDKTDIFRRELETISERVYLKKKSISRIGKITTAKLKYSMNKCH